MKTAQDFLRNGESEFVYHIGFLANDRQRMTSQQREMCNQMMQLALEGYFHLFQRRIGPNKFEYIARRIH